jgi:hypothetical protein
LESDWLSDSLSLSELTDSLSEPSLLDGSLVDRDSLPDSLSDWLSDSLCDSLALSLDSLAEADPLPLE